ncbi:MAG: hypothetical protein QM733_03175 [Ilumatobacteraceae bacterium]
MFGRTVARSILAVTRTATTAALTPLLDVALDVRVVLPDEHDVDRAEPELARCTPAQVTWR